MTSEEDSILYVFLAGTSFIVLMLTFILIYIILYQRKMARHQKELQEKELEKRFQVYDALLKGEEKERKRLAEELHDGIGAKLSGIKMNIEFLHQEIDIPMREHTGHLMDRLNEGINELREISHNLQPSVIGVKGLRIALEEFITSINQKKQTLISFFWHAEDIRFRNEQSELNIYRISTELITNIIKHARATEASLQVIEQDNELQIIVEDNGIGFETSGLSEGIGLINLRNRIEHEKGQLNIDSGPDMGTTIIITIPTHLTA